MERRSFLKVTAASLALGGCATSSTPPPIFKKLPEPTAGQRAGRLEAPSAVGILKTEGYGDDLFAILKNNLDLLNLSDIKGKSIVIKPNMVECPGNKPITTNPEVIKAVVQLVNYLGAAKIVVAEGPGHMRDTEAILAETGIGKACHEIGVPFIDLNLDDLVKVPLEEGFTGLDHFYLPRTITEANSVISLPKLKTHHWVGITCAMKNLFGLVPGRKYGYPKNVLHYKGIPQCILDLNRIVRTKLSVVDGIVAMEGDGPVNGTARKLNLLIVGQDPAAVDATCARIIGYNLNELDYIQMAGKVIGNVDPSEIKIVGAAIDEVKVDFQRPVTYSKDKEIRDKALRGGYQSGAS